MLDTLPRTAPHVRWTLLVPRGAQTPRRRGVVVAPVMTPPLPAALRKLWWEQIAAPLWARRLHADVLWIPYWAAPWWQPVPSVVTVHDLIPLLLPAYRGGMLQRTYTALVAATARRSARVLTVSEASARDVVTHLGVPATRVTAVHHGPNQANAQSPTLDECARVQARLQLPARFFLYLGGFDLRKNVTGLLRAYARYLEQGGDPAIKLVIAGRLPAEETPFAPDPRPIVHALGLDEQVHYAGWVEEADKPALYALATAYLFPSLYEGFGMTVLEAMQAGTPVVTSGETRIDG
jgi:glycosyltransferase involved in cell wall biosynthesis